MANIAQAETQETEETADLKVLHMKIPADLHDLLWHGKIGARTEYRDFVIQALREGVAAMERKRSKHAR